MKELVIVPVNKFNATLGRFRGFKEYSKTCVKPPLSKMPQLGFQDQLSLNAGQNYCRMLHREHSAMFSTFIELPFSYFISFVQYINTNKAIE